MGIENDGMHTIAIASFAPDGSATMQQWTVCAHLADELRTALRDRYGTPTLDTVATAEGVSAAAARAETATGTVHLFNLNERS